MSNMLTISREDIIQQVKISCQIPSIVEGIVTRKIITQAAQERKIQIETEELQVVADNLRLVSNLRSADATWSWLQKRRF